MKHRLFVFAGLFVALGSTGAVADDQSVCVERGLADQGYDPGPIDGEIDAATRLAANSFAAENGLTMPALTHELMREWCGTLANWEDRFSGPPILLGSPVSYAELGALASDDAGALPRGIHFSPSIPITLRRQILEDLAWLAGLGELRGAEHLAAAMDLPLPLSGRRMIEWLLDHTMAIAAPSDGCAETWIAAEAIARNGSCDDFVGGISPRSAVSLKSDDPVPGATAVLRHVGSMLVVAAEGPWVHMPVIYINPDHETWAANGAASQSNASRIARLTSLFHEASHVAFNKPHWRCRGEIPVANLVGQILPHTFCDEDIRTSAYLLGGLVGTALAVACDCDYRTRIDALIEAIGAMAGVTIPLNAPATTPNTAYLAAYQLAGVTYQFVLPAAYFDVAAIQVETFLQEEGCPCGNALDTLPDRLEEMRSLAESQYLVGNLSGPWLVVPRVEKGGDAPTASWADVWLHRALRSEQSGYNVPLTWVVDCSTLLVSATACNRRVAKLAS